MLEEVGARSNMEAKHTVMLKGLGGVGRTYTINQTRELTMKRSFTNISVQELL